MKIAIATILVALIAFAGIAQAEQNKGGVRTLTHATIDEVRHGDWLLVIVAPWCGYSKKLVPDLYHIAQSLKHVQVAVIDGETEPSIHLQFSLDSYPFISYVHDGSIHVYSGEPEWEPILKWATNDWNKVEPLVGVRNPFGWQMSVLGSTTHFFWSFYHLVRRNSVPFSISPQLAFGIIFGVCTIALLSIVICCVANNLDDTLADSPQGKPQPQPQSQQQQQQQQQQSNKKEEKPKEEKSKKGSSVRQRKTAKRLDD